MNVLTFSIPIWAICKRNHFDNSIIHNYKLDNDVSFEVLSHTENNLNHGEKGAQTWTFCKRVCYISKRSRLTLNQSARWCRWLSCIFFLPGVLFVVSLGIPLSSHRTDEHTILDHCHVYSPNQYMILNSATNDFRILTKWLESLVTFWRALLQNARITRNFHVQCFGMFCPLTLWSPMLVTWVSLILWNGGTKVTLLELKIRKYIYSFKR